MKTGRFLLRIAFIFFLVRFMVGCTFNPSRGNYGFMDCGFHLDQRGGCTCYRAGWRDKKPVMLPVDYVGPEDLPTKPVSEDDWEGQASDFNKFDQMNHPGDPGVKVRDMTPVSETPSSSPQSSPEHHEDHSG